MALRNKWIIGLFVIGVAAFAWMQFYILPKQAEQEEQEMA